MESKDKLKQIDIKNRMSYYFDGIIRFWIRDIDFSDILLDEKIFYFMIFQANFFNGYNTIAYLVQ